VVETDGGQIPNRRPMSERPAHIDKRLQVGHPECDTVIGANHKQAIVTVVERKSGYAVMAKVSNKTADLVGAAIIEALSPLKARVKTLTYHNGKEFSGHARIDDPLGSTGYFARPFARLGARLQRELQWPAAAIRTQEAPDGKYNGRVN